MKYLKIIIFVLLMLFMASCANETKPNSEPEKEKEEEPTPVEVKEFDVEFYVDGVLVSEQKVKEGEDAVKPTDPEIEGMVFSGWDTDFTNVKENLYINALFEKLIIKHKATFMVNGEIYEVIEVEEGKVLVYPADPEVPHYEFLGWDIPVYNGTRIKEDITITANLNQVEFLVEFYLDGELVHSEYVKEGEKPGEVTLDIPEGREFAGWDKEIGEIMEDTKFYGTTDVDHTNERNHINLAITEIENYFQSLSYPLVDGDYIDFKTKVLDVDIKWETSNDQAILETGRVKQPYTAKKAEEVNLTLTLTYDMFHTVVIIC